MPKTRVFIAIEPGAEVSERAGRILLRLRRLADNVKWVERENLHWTLHFLGELDDQEIYDVCQAAERAADKTPAFTMTTAGVGAFPNNERPRTLWMGVSQGGEEMARLYETLDNELRPLGFRGENRQYVAHLTLGRAGRGLMPGEEAALAEDLAKLTDFDGGTQAVDELTLFASRLRREGPEYAVLARFSLA